MSTPQDIALKDALRGIAMFKKVDVKVSGMEWTRLISDSNL